MDIIDGNARSENDQLPFNSIIHQNGANEDSVDFVGPRISRDTTRLSDNQRQSDNRLMPTHGLPNQSSASGSSDARTRIDVNDTNIPAYSVLQPTHTQTVYTDILPIYGQGFQNAEDMQAVNGIDGERVIDLAVVGHVTPYYARLFKQIELEFSVELRL